MGRHVIAIDVRRERVDRIASLMVAIIETGINPLISKRKDR
jgi:UDP-glucose 6-dehydrogenase